MQTLKYPLILGSQSPRRKILLQQMDVTFSTFSIDIDESYPTELRLSQVTDYISKKKWSSIAAHFIKSPHLILTADTMVFLDRNPLGKPKDREEAFFFLTSLSGRSHQVITSFSLGISSESNPVTIFDLSTVTFKDLSLETINSYIKSGSPFDKAGGYGIQDDIGQTFIARIDGSLNNVIGLPTELLASAIALFYC